jgi:hypothetical protein
MLLEHQLQCKTVSAHETGGHFMNGHHEIEGSPTEQSERSPAEESGISAEESRWQSDYEKWQQSRLDRVQASARGWLGLLTGLLGLLGSVVLFKGGDLVTEVTSNGAFQVALIALVALVFTGMVCAVLLGGAATWGGLKVDVETSNPQTSTSPPNRSFWQWRIPSIINFLALTSKTERTGVADGLQDWQAYRESVLQGAQDRRVYLHASRTVGVVTAGMIAVLVVVAVIAGTVSPTPTNVIVVHQGRISCGTVTAGTDQKGVTQVVPVTSC